jgi:hypothetical protein
MSDKVKWFTIMLPEDVLLGMISDYEYWARQLQSVVNSNDDMKHMLDYKDIAESLKAQMRED